MIQLCALTSSDRALVGRDGSAQQSIRQHNPQPKYQAEYCRGAVWMILQSNEPSERFTFDSPEITLICRADLLAGGAQDKARTSPAAHLASLYLRNGDSFVSAVEGTFAIILYDQRDRALKAWTDHFGVHPLAFTESAGFSGISTDLRLLLPLFPQKPEIDSAAIPQYLQYSCIPAPKTIYRGISRLQPAHQLTLNPRPVIRSYWDMTYPENRNRFRTEGEWAADMFEAVRSAVSRNVADLDSSSGCFLSGGTDSSSIAGLVGRLGQPPRTFSIGFDDPRYNEIDYARIAAKHFHADHHEYFVKPEDILALIQKAVPAYDEPFGNSSIIPTYFCARLAADNGVTHLLAGDGGDEIFGGNSRYVSDRVFQRYHSIPGWMRRHVIEPAVSTGLSWTGFRLFDVASRYIRRSNLPLPDRLFSYDLISSVPRAELFAPTFLSSFNGDHSLAPARHHFAAAQAQNNLNRWMYLDLKLTITDNDLRKVTTMSRLAGVTTRYPLLRPALAEFTGTIPAALKVKGNQLRYLFKRAMSEVLPHEIMTKQKHGFGLPYSSWVGEHKALHDFTFDVLGSARARQRGYFRPDLVEWLWSRYESEHRGYFGDMLWVFLMLELWHVTQHESREGKSPELTPVFQGSN